MGVVEGGVVKEGELGDVSRFLNRILGLKVHQQNLVRAIVTLLAEEVGRYHVIVHVFPNLLL